MSDTPQPNDSAPHALEPLQVDVIEAARLLRYSRAKIYEMLSSGELPSTRHGHANACDATHCIVFVRSSPPKYPLFCPPWGDFTCGSHTEIIIARYMQR